MNDKEYTKSRFIDLSRMSYEKGISIFSDFLTPAEISDLYGSQNQFLSAFALYGGYDGAERCMAAFMPQDMADSVSQTGKMISRDISDEDAGAGHSFDFPISCIKAAPLQKKFSENLTHRDYLGSLMNLGIDRCKLGDIVIKDGDAFIFVSESLAEFIAKSLTRVRHTSVGTSIVTDPGEIPHPELKEFILQVKSERIDAVVAKAYNLSRSQSSELFEADKVFVDGRLVENDTHKLKDGSTVSVRGYGKFVYRGITGTSKKGNLYIEIDKYV